MISKLACSLAPENRLTPESGLCHCRVWSVRSRSIGPAALLYHNAKIQL